MILKTSIQNFAEHWRTLTDESDANRSFVVANSVHDFARQSALVLSLVKLFYSNMDHGVWLRVDETGHFGFQDVGKTPSIVVMHVGSVLKGQENIRQLESFSKYQNCPIRF